MAGLVIVNKIVQIHFPNCLYLRLTYFQVTYTRMQKDLTLSIIFYSKYFITNHIIHLDFILSNYDEK